LPNETLRRNLTICWRSIQVAVFQFSFLPAKAQQRTSLFAKTQSRLTLLESSMLQRVQKLRLLVQDRRYSQRLASKDNERCQQVTQIASRNIVKRCLMKSQQSLSQSVLATRCDSHGNHSSWNQ
jgi:hypothetical protein